MDNRKKLIQTSILDCSQDANICYRRPGIISGAENRLICYYEEQTITDPKVQTLICRISDDGGINWSKRIVIASGGSTGMLHNIMMAYSNSVYYCLWNVQYRQLWYRKSIDGINWDEPVDLTRKLWRTDSEYEWNAFGIGSGHCVTLEDGTIIIPTWFTTGGDKHKPSAFACIYTKNQFNSINIGKPLVNGALIKNPNEGAIAVCGDDIVCTVRHDNDVRARAFVNGTNGIDGWTNPVFRMDLPDPICHASLLAKGERLFFCNCNNSDPLHEENYQSGKSKFIFSEDSRKDLTLRESPDGGKSFDEGIIIDRIAGYNDIACVKDKIICIYETMWNIEQSCIFPHGVSVGIVQI